MELTKQDIQKIDDYLKRGINFWDIRLEMIDHLASKLEQSEDVNLNDDFFKKEFGTPWELLNKKSKTLRKQISRKYRIQVRKEFVNFFKKVENIGLMSMFLFIVYFLFFIFKQKVVLFIILSMFGILLVFLSYFSIKKSYKIKKSYSLSMLTLKITFPLFFISFIDIIQVFEIPISKTIVIRLIIYYLFFSSIWMYSGFKVFLRMIDKHEKVFTQYKFLKIQ